MQSLLEWITRLFPLWLVVGAALSLQEPERVTWFSGPWITISLGLIMTTMGLSLKAEDFRLVFRLPWRVGLGVLLQYTVMPLAGGLLGHFFGLPPAMGAGIALVSSCPGGTASNVIAYLARANLALSVTMTAVSTLMASVMTPALATLTIGSVLEVNTVGLFLSTLQVVLLPIILGVGFNTLFPRTTERILPMAPPVAVFLIVMIVSSIIGQGKELILSSPGHLLLAVVTLHAFGFLIGYGISRLLFDEKTARTISIEVGMQNSGLGVVLARANFSDPAVAIPSAISSIVHSILGSFLAATWRRRPTSGDDKKMPLQGI